MQSSLLLSSYGMHGRAQATCGSTSRRSEKIHDGLDFAPTVGASKLDNHAAIGVLHSCTFLPVQAATGFLNYLCVHIYTVRVHDRNKE